MKECAVEEISDRAFLNYFYYCNEVENILVAVLPAQA